jgi:hypothetical protein
MNTEQVVSNKDVFVEEHTAMYRHVCVSIYCMCVYEAFSGNRELQAVDLQPKSWGGCEGFGLVVLTERNADIPLWTS